MAYSFDAETAKLTYVLAARLNRLARRCRAPACDCDDCVQDAFLALLKAHPDWMMDDPRTVAWLAGVVRNKALDLHRLSQRRTITLLDEPASIPSADPSQAIEEDKPDSHRRRVVLDLQQLLNDPPADNREILIRRVQLKLSYREIGEPLGLTANQVKSRYNRAVKTLRHSLESESNGLNQHDCMDDITGGGIGFVRILC